jgi:excisionase family DNA binding protein
MSNHEDSLSVPLQETNFDNLYLLSAGQSPVDPASLLTSPRLPALLEFLKSRGDVILMNSPPVLGPPDATVLATLAEGTILVTSAGLTRREMLQRAKGQLLTQRRVNLLGLVVNRVKLNTGYYRYEPNRGGEEPNKGKDNGTWLTLGEAAARLGISKGQARQWCKSERLPAVRKALWWRVDREKLEHMIENTKETKELV